MPQSNRMRVEVWCPSGESCCEFSRVDVPIQPGVSIFLFFVFFLPMVSQDYSIVFFCYINRNSHYLVWFVKKKHSMKTYLMTNLIILMC
jgi:hypothetical protein